uniref:Lipocalin n=1 Tax=Rhipicephalus appendiculatus TaxID=34631 RepID=A0A131Z3U7_RHIAP
MFGNIVVLILFATVTKCYSLEDPPIRSKNTFQQFWSDNSEMWTYQSSNKDYQPCRREQREAITQFEFNLTESYKSKDEHRNSESWSFLISSRNETYDSMWKMYPEERNSAVGQTLLLNKSEGPCAVVKYEVFKEDDATSAGFTQTTHYNLLAGGEDPATAAKQCEEEYQKHVKSGDKTLYNAGCKKSK